LLFSVLRPHAGRFCTSKVEKQTTENLYKKHFLEKFSFHCFANKGLVMYVINLINIFLFYTLLRISFAEKKEMDQIFVTFHVHTTCRDNFVFQSLFVFPPGLRVGLTILN
jgi:hypothetical protein